MQSDLIKINRKKLGVKYMLLVPNLCITSLFNIFVSDLLECVVCKSILLKLRYLVELTQRYFVKIAMTELGKKHFNILCTGVTDSYVFNTEI